MHLRQQRLPTWPQRPSTAARGDAGCWPTAVHDVARALRQVLLTKPGICTGCRRAAGKTWLKYHCSGWRAEPSCTVAPSQLPSSRSASSNSGQPAVALLLPPAHASSHCCRVGHPGTDSQGSTTANCRLQFKQKKEVFIRGRCRCLGVHMASCPHTPPPHTHTHTPHTHTHTHPRCHIKNPLTSSLAPNRTLSQASTTWCSLCWFADCWVLSPARCPDTKIQTQAAQKQKQCNTQWCQENACTGVHCTQRDQI